MRQCNLLVEQWVTGRESLPVEEVDGLEQAREPRFRSEMNKLIQRSYEFRPRHGQSVLTCYVILALFCCQQGLHRNAGVQKNETLVQFRGMACSRRDKLVRAGDENRLCSNLFAQIDHEPQPFGGPLVRVWTQIPFAINGLEARLAWNAIDA